MSQTLEKRFHKLRGQIEGLRPRRRYENQYFISLEEELGCVPVNRWHTRILSEIDFCLQMKLHMGTDVTTPLDAALNVLEQAYKEDGAIPDSVCKRAEECLMPLAEEANTYSLIVAGHAHIDMNWKWSWDETVATVIATFRTMLKLMEEYPEFHFSQSQAAIYKIIEDYAPSMMPEIQKRIREGRWEVTASTWVEMDKNMPCTDSLQNQILYAKKYLKEHWDIDSEAIEIDFAPDTFGHSAYIPEIDGMGNLKYMYHFRGRGENNQNLYRWKAPSGKEILCYREPCWYSSNMIPRHALGLPRQAKTCGGFRTGLFLLGVGDHGGGPTRRDLNNALWMQQWPVFPKLRFGQMHEFFRKAEAVRNRLPVIERELNAVFTGCYTTQSRIKRGNRRAETALLNAEKLSALVSYEVKEQYSENAFEKAWQDTLFTHFHDILTGSCVQDTREHAMGLYQNVMAVANTEASFALQTLAESIDTSSLGTLGSEDDDSTSRSFGAGGGYLAHGNIPTHETGTGMNRIFHVINTTSIEREENVLLTVWDWPGKLEWVEVMDAQGNVIPSERISDWKIFWQHRYFEILVTVKVPAYGYTTVVLCEKDPIEVTEFIPNSYWFSQHTPTNDIVLENEYLKASFDSCTGELYSLIDKVAGRERIREGERGGLRYIIAQKHKDSSWVIDRWVDVQKVEGVLRLQPIEGTLQSGLEIKQKVATSIVNTKITLGSKDKFLKVQMEIDWKEESKGKEEQPILSYCLPIKEATGRWLCDVPGGALWREAQELDMPCQRYGAAESPDGRVLALASDCKYGYRMAKGNLYVTLINTSENPDPYPERGIHEITLFIIPTLGEAIVLSRETDICLNPLQYVTNTSHAGIMSVTGTLLDTKGDTVVFSGVAWRENGLAIRMYEAEGKTCPVTITLNKPISEAYITDLFGNKQDIDVKVEGMKVSLHLPAYTQGELRIYRQNSIV